MDFNFLANFAVLICNAEASQGRWFEPSAFMSTVTLTIRDWNWKIRRLTNLCELIVPSMSKRAHRDLFKSWLTWKLNITWSFSLINNWIGWGGVSSWEAKCLRDGHSPHNHQGNGEKMGLVTTCSQVFNYQKRMSLRNSFNHKGGWWKLSCYIGSDLQARQRCVFMGMCVCVCGCVWGSPSDSPNSLLG